MIRMPKFSGLFSAASAGGNRRPVLICAVAVVVIGGTFIVATHHSAPVIKSDSGRMVTMNGMPGGTNSTPLQNDMRKEDQQENANKAAAAGSSYTPDIAPGQLTNPDRRTLISGATPAPREVGYASTPGSATAPTTTAAPPLPTIAPPPATTPIPTDARYTIPPQNLQQEQQASTARRVRYQKAISALEASFTVSPPLTQVLTPQFEVPATNASQRAAGNPSSAASQASEASEQIVLIPAGRGIYAHTVTATNSDLNGQIVLEADSGPIAGDRMIASATRAGGHENLLIVAVTSIIHHGKTLSANGMVIAPDSMQAGVASSVDPLILQRFVLPAAAAFVQGLGQAIETTSGTVGQVGALGNFTYTQKLNLPQQFGIAAGTAAQSVQSAIQQDTPTRARINLAANVNVSVMFMEAVVDKH